VNQYETQRILESFEDAGFGIVPFDSVADVYVINSCSVTSIAESKSRYTIRRAGRLNPNSKVVVTGCASQMAMNRGEGLEGADLLVPNPEKLETWSRFANTFPDLASQAQRQPAQEDGPERAHRTRATLKVQDGCSVMCSYCSIPFTRPGMQSRPYVEVLAEAQRFAELGYREIILTGVLIGAYGPETGSGGPDFETMVEGLACHLGRDVRIRISSIEMRQVTSRLIELLKDGQVVPHLHIPLQSGDDGVLRDMNRAYTQSDYLTLCAMLYESVPGISLSTDIMVGFPTETSERFESSVHVCRKANYIKAHVFRFSPRWGTPADRFKDPIDAAEKQRRSLVLSEVARGTRDRHLLQFIGQKFRVLVESKVASDGMLEGLTDNYIDIRFPGPRSLQRQFATVRLDEVRDGIGYGELASATDELRVLV
jgi:threonylcarbamoyladenosine tRNA methylthiotransferase MtaB